MPDIVLAKPSVQSLLLQMAVNDHPLSTGTGFVCQSRRGPVLITNRHNFTGRDNITGQPLSPTGGIPDRVTILHNKRRQLGRWVPREESLIGEPWIEHPTLRENADFVALPLTNLDDVELYPYEPPRETDVRLGPGAIVSVVGFPFGLRAGGSLAVWATGFIATEPDVNFNDLPIFLVDCRTRPGQSGSAVIFNSDGGMLTLKDGSIVARHGSTTILLGVYSGRINKESDIGIVWKASAILELIESID